MDTIKCMKAFTAVANQNSFTAGAKQLGISTKLASKYVQHLEEHLGAQLFNRTTRKVTLTHTGQNYYTNCTPLLSQFDELESLVHTQNHELAGLIRITAPTGFGSRELIQALGPFQQENPKVNIDLQLSDQRVDIIGGAFDFAVRFGKLADSSFIARKILNMRMVVIAAPAYLAEHGEPNHPSELLNHNCLLQMSALNPEQWKFKVNSELTTYRVNGNFQANSPRATTHMALSGLGITMCPLYVVKEFINSGELKVLFADQEASDFSLYAIYPQNKKLPARVNALIVHLVNTLNDIN